MTDVRCSGSETVSDSQVNSCWENRNLWLVIEQASVGTGRVTVAVIKQTLHQASTKNRNRWFSLMVKSLHSCFSYQCLYQSEIKEAIQTGLHWWLGMTQRPFSLHKSVWWNLPSAVFFPCVNLLPGYLKNLMDRERDFHYCNIIF